MAVSYRYLQNSPFHEVVVKSEAASLGLFSTRNIIKLYKATCPLKIRAHLTRLRNRRFHELQHIHVLSSRRGSMSARDKANTYVDARAKQINYSRPTALYSSIYRPQPSPLNDGILLLYCCTTVTVILRYRINSCIFILYRAVTTLYTSTVVVLRARQQNNTKYKQNKYIYTK